MLRLEVDVPPHERGGLVLSILPRGPGSATREAIDLVSVGLPPCAPVDWDGLPAHGAIGRAFGGYPVGGHGEVESSGLC